MAAVRSRHWSNRRTCLAVEQNKLIIDAHENLVEFEARLLNFCESPKEVRCKKLSCDCYVSVQQGSNVRAAGRRPPLGN